MRKLAALLLGVALASQASAASPEFCTVFTREWVRVVVLHNLGVRNSPSATEEAKKIAQEQLDLDIEKLYQRNYSICLNRDDYMLKLPNVRVAGDAEWIDFMRRSAIELEPEAEPEVDPETAARHKWCHAHFRTYRESDGTVIKRGNRTKRSACPFPG